MAPKQASHATKAVSSLLQKIKQRERRQKGEKCPPPTPALTRGFPFRRGGKGPPRRPLRRTKFCVRAASETRTARERCVFLRKIGPPRPARSAAGHLKKTQAKKRVAEEALTPYLALVAAQIRPNFSFSAEASFRGLRSLTQLGGRRARQCANRF